MSEWPDSADGLGTSSAGTPGFVRPGASAPGPDRSRPPPLPAPPAPPRTARWPAAVSAAVVLLVVGVTLVATLVARDADRRVAAPPPRSRPAAAPGTPAGGPDGIDFTASRGTGRLVLRERTWEARRLRVSVELICTSGTVDHAPTSFQLFDADGALVEASSDAGSVGIGFGTLQPGERVRGEVVFDLSRQVATLVLSDDAGSVTALKVPA